MQKAVTGYFLSKQLLHFAFQHGSIGQCNTKKMCPFLGAQSLKHTDKIGLPSMHIDLWLQTSVFSPPMMESVNVIR